jgi:hypothetical protein
MNEAFGRSTEMFYPSSWLGSPPNASPSPGGRSARAAGGFLRGGDAKITHAATLDLSGALDDHQRLGRDARLDPG